MIRLFGAVKGITGFPDKLDLGVNLGKKSASGTGTISTGYGSFSISNLAFTPSMVIVAKSDKEENAVITNIATYQFHTYTGEWGLAYYGGSANNGIYGNNTGIIDTNGFTFKEQYGLTGTYNWIAYE